MVTGEIFKRIVYEKESTACAWHCCIFKSSAIASVEHVGTACDKLRYWNSSIDRRLDEQLETWISRFGSTCRIPTDRIRYNILGLIELSERRTVSRVFLNDPIGITCYVVLLEEVGFKGIRVHLGFIRAGRLDHVAAFAISKNLCAVSVAYPTVKRGLQAYQDFVRRKLLAKRKIF